MLGNYNKQSTSLYAVYLSHHDHPRQGVPLDHGVRQATYETCKLALDQVLATYVRLSPGLLSEGAKWANLCKNLKEKSQNPTVKAILDPPVSSFEHALLPRMPPKRPPGVPQEALDPPEGESLPQKPPSTTQATL